MAMNTSAYVGKFSILEMLLANNLTSFSLPVLGGLALRIDPARCEVGCPFAFSADCVDLDILFM